MNVLSLFDGMSCAQIALNRIEVEYDKYFASEVDKYAIAVTQANYPDTIQLGGVENVCTSHQFGIQQLPTIDLLIGGSPCQGFSFAGKQLNFTDKRSQLIFEYVRILNTLKPKYFILENVNMKQEFQDVISKFLGVKPVAINSSLVSAQNRKRLYWTNIPEIIQPLDKQIFLKDIIHEGHIVDREKALCLDANYSKGGGAGMYFDKSRRQILFEEVGKYKLSYENTKQMLDKEVDRGKIGHKNGVYYIHGKDVKLGVDGSYLFGCITPNRINKRQNGQRFNNGQKFYTLTAQDQHGILTDGYIRKLTPIECERLQTVPEDYTNHVSNTQRYKMLGNGMTVDVMGHILNGMERYADCGCLEEDVDSHWCGCCQVMTTVCHHNPYGTCQCS